MKITVENTYHGTSATLRPRERDGKWWVSRRTWLRARRQLCGREGCTCGDRDRITDAAGRRMYLDWYDRDVAAVEYR